MQPILRVRPELPHAASRSMHRLAQVALSELATVGFTAMRGAIGAAALSGLRAEALRNRHDTKAAASRSGHGYRAHVSGLGEAGRAFLCGPVMTTLTSALFAAPLTPGTDASCYTYYEPGDFLGAHTDHPAQCPVTAIVYVDVVRPERESSRTGLELHVLEAAPSGERRQVRKVLPTRAGTLVIGLGSITWHERPPLRDGEHLVALTACYAPAPAAST